MGQRTIALGNAIGFFIFWLLLLLAGADRPPPPGFIWIVVAVGVSAVVVYWRIPTYLAWYRTRRPGRAWRVARDGLVAGLLVALPFALTGSGEPTVVVQPRDAAIWFLVAGMVGVLNAAALYAINALVARRSMAGADTSKRDRGA